MTTHSLCNSIKMCLVSLHLNIKVYWQSDYVGAQQRRASHLFHVASECSQKTPPSGAEMLRIMTYFSCGQISAGLSVSMTSAVTSRLHVKAHAWKRQHLLPPSLPDLLWTVAQRTLNNSSRPTQHALRLLDRLWSSVCCYVFLNDVFTFFSSPCSKCFKMTACSSPSIVPLLLLLLLHYFKAHIPIYF